MRTIDVDQHLFELRPTRVNAIDHGQRDATAGLTAAHAVRLLGH